ncbi:MAG: ABC transporter permease subunit [Succinivibrionaceae bacterium]|nr:ABC transporter permease subunit [Ruminobacter sp.]MEE1340430.1 ABC transporter permease subunit [Succinivibrionaceae bacterium]
MKRLVKRMITPPKKLSGWRKYAVISLPYLWNFLFFFVPFLIILKISFAESAISIPPFTSLFGYEDDKLTVTLNLYNYKALFEDDTYLFAYLKSLKIAFFSTFFCILIGYPVAWAIATSKPSIRNVLLMLVILPSWTSFLIRVYAWIGILKKEGIINNFLMAIGVIDEPIQMLQTDFAVYLGIVYAYLPFMILPLYTAIVRVDYTIIEAGYDLGCRPVGCFIKLFLPQTYSGIIAGSMLVFIPAVGEYVIPELLGGKDSNLIGRVLWSEFFNNRDWPLASALATIMLIILAIPIIWFYKNQRKEMARTR